MRNLNLTIITLIRYSAIVLMILALEHSLSAQTVNASFTSSSVEGCAPLSINFTNSSTGAVSYQWIFGNGNFSTLQNPQNVYVNPGTYTVSLIAIAANGTRDTLTQTNYITAAPGPSALFTSSTNQGCSGQTNFSFTNNTVGAVSYFWDFDDGTSSLQSNPIKQYAQPGTYHVSLLATNSNGCQSVYNVPQNIVVNPVPNANFSANQTEACQLDEYITFTPSIANASSYLWNFGDGTTSTSTNPNKNYSQPGIYSVSLIITNSFGCADTISRNNYITINSPIEPQIIASNTNACLPLITQFTTNVTNAIAYAWDFGNGQTSNSSSQTVNYSTGGVFSPQLTVTMGNGCEYSVTAEDYIQANPLPVAQFNVTNNTGCAPLTPSFSNTSTGASSFFWTFGNGETSTDFEPSITFTQGGLQFVRLRAVTEAGCSTQVQINGAISVTTPIANFSATNTTGCPPLNVQFTNTGSSSGNFLWNFGDGTTSTEQNPSHLYTQLGEYDVSLIISNGVGCQDTITQENLVYASNEVALYTPPTPITACSPFTASFEIEEDPDANYIWDFGDGTVINGGAPSYMYTEPGVYVISLLVENGSPCGLIYPEYQTIIIEGETPEFEVSVDVCPPHAVTFNDGSEDAESWLWDFGDGTTSTDESPVHTYPNMLNHHVSLTTTTTNGCSYSYIEFNAVSFTSTVATFTSTYIAGEFPQTVEFTSTNPSATAWSWDFGDGNTSTEENPTHTYLTEEDYQVTLQIETEDCFLFGSGEPFESAADDVAQDTVTGGSYPNGSEILPAPLRGCAPLNIKFQKQNPTHLVLEWHFGDGTISTLQNPYHLFTQPGHYSVYYTAMTPYGLDTIEYNQSIYLGGGIPDFTIAETPFCEHSQVDVSILNPGAVDEILWNFGGTGNATTPTASWDFPFANSAYTVQVRVVDTLGCISSRMKSILVSPPIPEVSFPSSICRDTVQFTHNLSNLPGYSYLWDFGDGNTSTEAEPYHFYTYEDEFTVTLTITTPEGCVTTSPLSHTIIVGFPIIDYTLSDPIVGCTPLTVTFQNNGLGVCAYFFTDGSWSGGVFNPNATYTKVFTQPGNYQFYQRSFSALRPGCMYQELSESVITVYDANADFSFTQQGLCDPIEAQFTDLSEDATAWEWDFGNGITSIEQNPEITFNSYPADSISLTITNSHGCSATAIKDGLLTLEAEAEASFTGNCNPLPVEFHASEEGMISWDWDFGDGSTAEGANPYHLYTENGNYIATVIVTSAENCRDTVSLEVPINVVGPTAAFHSPTPANCAPSVVEFFDTSMNAIDWFWDFGDGTFANIANPVKLYDSPGVYDVTLVVYSSDGCADTLLKPEYVTVLGPATTFEISSYSECMGANVQFTDLSIGAVEWEWNFGEGTTSNEQNPSFTYNEEGNFIITLFSKDTLGCSAFYTIPEPIQIHPYPEANFSISDTSGCAPLVFSTSNESTGALQYNWLLNGQPYSNEIEPNFNLSIAGTYDIHLIATTQHGCSDSASFNGIESFLVPVSSFTIGQTEGCTPLSVTFNNESYQLSNADFLWNFGNGNTSTETSPTEVFFDPNFYTVSLTVTNASGCADTLILPSIINVYDTLPAPVTPILRVTVNDEQSVQIDWEQSLAPDFGSYRVYRKNNQTGNFEFVREILEAHVVSYIDQGLNTLESSYCYKLQTIDRCGFNFETDSLIEHCSINVEANTLEDHTIDVDWTPYIGKQASQYRIFRTEENTNIVEDLGTVPGDMTKYIDSNVFCPVTYRYDIRAEGLNGQWHVESNSDFDNSERLPNLFKDQQVNASRSTVVENRFILTEWRRPEIMGNRVSGYKVFRSTDNNYFTPIASLPADQTFYVDQSVDVNSKKYFYRIMATNECDLEGIEGGFSDNVVLNAEAAGEFYIQLEWTPYTGWGDDGVDFYILERQNEDGSWEVLHQLPGNVTTAVDEN